MYVVKGWFTDDECGYSNECVIWKWNDSNKDLPKIDNVRQLSPFIKFNCPDCYSKTKTATLSSSSMTCFVVVRTHADKYRLCLDRDYSHFSWHKDEAGCWFRCPKCDPRPGYLLRSTEKSMVRILSRRFTCCVEIIIAYCGAQSSSNTSQHLCFRQFRDENTTQYVALFPYLQDETIVLSNTADSR